MSRAGSDEWLFDAVHALSSAYGWTKQEILATVYPDEIEYYMKRIRKEKVNDRLSMLALIHNPHVQDPKKLILELQKMAMDDDGKYYDKQRMEPEDMRQMDEIKRLMQANAEARKNH